MELRKKIKKLREVIGLHQKDMASQMNLCSNAYGRLERGDTQISTRRLKQIATIFNIPPAKLIDLPIEELIIVVLEANRPILPPTTEPNPIHQYQLELEKLRLQLNHAEYLISQKEKEIQLLQDLIQILKTK